MKELLRLLPIGAVTNIATRMSDNAKAWSLLIAFGASCTSGGWALSQWRGFPHRLSTVERQVRILSRNDSLNNKFHAREDTQLDNVSSRVDTLTEKLINGFARLEDNFKMTQQNHCYLKKIAQQKPIQALDSCGG